MHGNISNDCLCDYVRRETRSVLANRGCWGILSVLCILTGFVAPFGTFAASPVERHLYWTTVFAGTLVAGHFAITVLEYHAARLAWRAPVRLVVGTLVGALPVTGIVAALSLPFGLWDGASDLFGIYWRCAIIVGAVLMILQLAPSGPGLVTRQQVPAILRRLPGARRGQLVRLEAQNHYVEVVTQRGRALTSMRLGDAVKEAHPIAGAQVHRSHWVATDAVEGWARVGGQLRLRLTDGSLIPVGRTYRTAARAAGLLPQSDGVTKK